ncbi:hypothetical protein PoB_000646600 [Plakobranchus ocellatus]|uniref:Uncharacterized protein n=1 Tax=Plakobranchus ocellatus TaxID=259542 RepID=A0AAV3YC60_9GAST|nr:hypothetical protein PoB_000646600 [Plakobranchus ocellatus]
MMRKNRDGSADDNDDDDNGGGGGVADDDGGGGGGWITKYRVHQQQTKSPLQHLSNKRVGEGKWNHSNTVRVQLKHQAAVGLPLKKSPSQETGRVTEIIPPHSASRSRVKILADDTWIQLGLELDVA